MGLFTKDSAPKAPDYSAIAAANEKSAELAFQLGQQQFDWAKQVYANDSALTEQVVADFLRTSDQNYQNALADRARYEQIYQPLEDQLAADALSYSSPERKDLEMGRAQAAVAQQFDGAREAAQRELESFGINPAATRYAALDIGMRTQEAAAKAAAGNNAAQMVDATGRALRSEAINVGRGYPGQIAGTYNTALQAGQGAVNSNLNTTASGAATMGTAPQYMALGNQALGQWGNTVNMGYQNQLAQYNAQQNASSGIGSILGIAGGIAAKQYFRKGGAVELEYEGGGGVPPSASPSAGAAVDDVEAALNVGEFVMPEEAVRWHGEKAMYAMIEKAQQGREEAKQRTGAVPSAIPLR
jgi:hypothetical protein